jgi:hypothetical protein
MIRLFLPLSLLCVLAIAPGCVAVVAGAAAAGTMAYVSNESAKSYPAAPDAAWTATLEALRDVGYAVDPSALPYASGRDEFEIEDVKIQVRGGDAGTTRVWVRVGTFNNEKNREKAASIHAAIAKRLGV